MRTNRWQPLGSVWGQLNQLQQEMNRVFDNWTETGGRALGLTAPSFPPVTVWEEGDELGVEAELPGLELQDLEIFITNGNQLTIKGERKPHLPEKANLHRQERGYGSFARVLTLPWPVDPERVSAQFQNGVLVVKLTKHESARPRRIAVNAG